MMAKLGLVRQHSLSRRCASSAKLEQLFSLLWSCSVNNVFRFFNSEGFFRLFFTLDGVPPDLFMSG